VGGETKELIAVLEELATLIEADGQTHWSAWMREAQLCLRGSDYSGVEHLLSAYGGMGSFSDLVIGQTYRDGVFAWKPGAEEINTRLNTLRSRAYQLATPREVATSAPRRRTSGARAMRRRAAVEYGSGIPKMMSSG
jgi:hypothetical protein